MADFELNKQQQKAVNHDSGPLMILAGAGAGKTRVITLRILELIKKGVAPQEILAVTFTNKAAKEMRERVLQLIDNDKEINRPVSARATRIRSANGQAGFTTPFVATFHSLGVTLLRENARELGIKRHFTIFDRADSIRAIKQSIKHLGLDPKQFEPRTVLSVISRNKADGLQAKDYHADLDDTWRHTLGRIWEEYEKRLEKDGSLDFDDLLLRTYILLRDNADVREKYQKRWVHVHVDEYQDTNRVQFAITQLLVGKKANICVVGDIDQCLVAGTKISMADDSYKKIENIKKGDEVLSNFGSGEFRPAKVTRTFAKKYTGSLLHIHTKNGETITSTPEHMHFADFHLGTTPQLFFTYIMYKKDIGWRIGTSQTYTNGQKKSVVGFIQRCNQEHADALWVIETHTTPQQARELEYILSLKYQLPTLSFVARKGLSTKGYVHDQNVMDRIFAEFDTEITAKKLLKDYSLSAKHPHHTPQSRNSNRQNIRITLCGDSRGKTPIHRISMIGSSSTDKKILESLGYSIPPAKRGSKSWRFETGNKSWKELYSIAENIQKAFPNSNIISYARIGSRQGSLRGKNSLKFLPAASIKVGMVVCNQQGKWVCVEKVERTPTHTTNVYDIDVAHTHNFIANNIVTHNCIYSWRGASLGNLLAFEEEFPGTTLVVLEENYRSTQNILSAANKVIEKNVKRKEKTLFTNNEVGEPINLYSAYSEDDEARFIVEKASELIAEGAQPKDIAILYRANFQSRVLEQAFMYAGIPYQVLGTRFFDRREVKDVLSYIRAALNPDSQGDIARIISTPPRGIGKMTLAKMLEGKESELAPAAQRKVADFKSILSSIRTTALKERPSETIRFAVQKSGLEMKLKGGTEEERERLENIKELATLASKYDDLDPEEGIERLLEDAALATDQDSLEKNHNAVKLMTVHASKGLEFNYVFITGLEEGLFPHERIGEDVDDEEERRLFYVAITRACKKVFLTHAVVRTIYGSQTMQIASQFIEDIGEENIEVLNKEYESPHERKVDLIDF